MKLIDAEKLKAEIERLKAKYRKDMYKSNYEGLASGYKIEAYNELLLSLDSLQQEQPSEICSKCIHHGKDDGYCYNPHGGMQRLINENGVYECTGFCEQEQPEVDLKEEVRIYCGSSFRFNYDELNDSFYSNAFEFDDVVELARHFYELGKNSK